MKLLRICSSVFLILGQCALGYADEHFPFSAHVAKKSVNIRAGANTNFERLDQLSEGDQVTVIGKSFEWYKVQLPATAKAYIRADYLKITQNSQAEVLGDKVNVRAAATSDSTSLGMVKKGDTVKVVAQTNNWWQLEPPATTYGWIRQDFLSTSSTNVKKSETKQTAALPTALPVIEVKGKLKALTQPQNGLNYELIVEGSPVYYVQSVPNIDRFKGGTVLIKGVVIPDPAHVSAYPVLQTLNISLLL